MPDSIRHGSAAIAALALAACTGMPPPTGQFAVTRTAIDDAQSAGAPRHAPVELNAARSKLGQAERAVVQGDNDLAHRLAEQAEADAKLAAARARSTSAQEAVAAVQDSIRTLREELSRAATRQPAS